MTEQKRQKLAEIISEARTRKGMSGRELANQVGIANSNIVRLEKGIVTEPRPALLASLARALDLDLADLYTAVGYEQPQELPSFAPYLRSKYGGLPAEAALELEQSFTKIVDKYGYDPAGPRPGEDEQ